MFASHLLMIESIPTDISDKQENPFFLFKKSLTYRSTSQICRGEIFLQQAVPVTKELEMKKKSYM